VDKHERTEQTIGEPGIERGNGLGRMLIRWFPTKAKCGLRDKINRSRDYGDAGYAVMRNAVLRNPVLRQARASETEWADVAGVPVAAAAASRSSSAAARGL